MTMSPRISFSHDLSQSDTVPVEQLLRSFSSSSSVDLNFCVQQNPIASTTHHLHHPSPPTQIKHHPSPPPPLPPQSPLANHTPLSAVTKSNKIHQNHFGDLREAAVAAAPLLSRSNSAGSSTSTKRSSSSKEGFTHKHSHNSQKPPLRKSSYSYGNNTNTCNRRPPELPPDFVPPPVDVFVPTYLNRAKRDKPGNQSSDKINPRAKVKKPVVSIGRRSTPRKVVTAPMESEDSKDSSDEEMVIEAEIPLHSFQVVVIW
ncbi:hypothetical protein L1887_03318 [Cichorium endivia]|nr:hypothetical protein L1887_03318 [Cichorium endivia]